MAAVSALALVGGAGGTLAAPAQASGDVDEIVVTGTNVRGLDLGPVVNLQTVDRVQLESSGAVQIADLIKVIPANTGTTLYNENGTLTGTAQFSLRGLGYSSTLTLLNGRRAGVAPLSDRTQSDFVDVNQFPLAMVARMDVLKDGSSAIYGSEAVAGVVNIVTRKGFEGLELSADYATSTNDAYSVSLASGKRFERGTANLYATYYHQTQNVRSDFDWLRERVGGNGNLANSQLTNNNGWPGTYSLATLNAQGVASAATGATTVPDPNCLQAGGIFANNASGAPVTSACNINFADQVAVIPNSERIQAFFEGDYKITDRLTYFNEASFSRNHNKLSETAGGFSNGAASNGFIYVPANAPFNFFVQDPANPRNIIAINPANWDPAIHTAVPVVGNFRPQGNYYAGSKIQNNTYLRMLNGLEASFAQTWRAQLSHQWAVGEYVENNSIGVDSPALNNLIATGQYNPFGSSIVTPNLVSPKDRTKTAANSQAIIDQIFYTTNINRRTEQNVVDASVSGVIWKPSTGPISLAAGGQFRSQSLKHTPDGLVAAGLGTSRTRDVEFEGSQKVWSQYAELIVPFGKQVDVQAALRHEDYGGAVGSTTDPKISAHVDLFGDRVGLRGSWGTSFQAPTLQQGSTSTLLQLVNDPVVLSNGALGCAANSQGAGVIVITSGGGLKPQHSNNLDLGVSLDLFDGFSFSVDGWRYDYQDLIAPGQNAQSVLTGECSGGVYRPDPRVTRNVGGQALTVTQAFVNVGKVVAQGFDFSTSYRIGLGGAGDLRLRGDLAYTRKFDVYSATGVVSNRVGNRNFNTNFAPMSKWRGRGQATWSKGAHELSAALNYTSGYLNDQDNNAPVDSFTTIDLQYALTFAEPLGVGRDLKVSVGVNNLFDVDPPGLERYTAAGVPVTGHLASNRPGYDPLSGVNIQGRMVYARLKQTF